MITDRSLSNKRRRFPELRRSQSKIRSLKRRRFSSDVWGRRMGGQLAIVKLFVHTEEFLDCSFSQYHNSNAALGRALKRMKRALRHMSRCCEIAAAGNRSVDTSAIRDFGAASTYLYQTARRSGIVDDCDECWRLLGLCFHATF